MTKLTFEQLKKDNRFLLSTKAWYKTFPFKITFKGWDMFDDSYLNMFHKYSSISTRMKSMGHEFKSRHDTNYSLYLKDLAAVHDVLFYFNKDVIKISGPLSQQHQDMLLTDMASIYRKQYYYNKFKYKISFQKTRHDSDIDIFEDISDFVTSTFDSDTYYLNTALRQYSTWKALDNASRNTFTTSGLRIYRRAWVPYQLTGTVYFKEYDDACTMHIMYKTHITSSTKVVLIEDLE